MNISLHKFIKSPRLKMLSRWYVIPERINLQIDKTRFAGVRN